MSTKQERVPSGARDKEGDAANCPPNMQRRRFLLYSAAGIAAVLIPGHLSPHNRYRQDQPEVAAPEPGQAAAPSKPMLQNGVISFREGELHVFEYRSGNDNQLRCGCAVNEAGAKVIHHLDGQHTVEQLSRLISMEGGHADPHTACAEIAQFVAELGGIGFLTKPYYAQIYERYES